MVLLEDHVLVLVELDGLLVELVHRVHHGSQLGLQSSCHENVMTATDNVMTVIGSVVEPEPLFLAGFGAVKK